MIIQCNINVTLVQNGSMHAQLEVCIYICSAGKCAYAQLMCTCSTESMHKLKCKSAHTQMKMCSCLTESVHMLK